MASAAAMATRKSFSQEDRHTYAVRNHGTDRNKLTVFVQSDKKDDGTLHPAKVSIRRQYRKSDGTETTSYVQIPAHDIAGLIEDLQEAQKVNEQYFKAELAVRPGSGVRIPDSLMAKR